MTIHTLKRDWLSHTELKKLLSTVKNRKHAFGDYWLEVEDVSMDKAIKGKGEWGQKVTYHKEELRYNVRLNYTVKEKK